jgi:penicillin amidase
VVVSRHNALSNNASEEPNTARAVRLIGEAALARRKKYEPATVRLTLDSGVARLMDAVGDGPLLAAYTLSKSVPVFRGNEIAAAWRRPAAADSVAPRDTTIDRWESNNWVLAGSRTASGKPIVANDPHRTISEPSLRYMVHLKAPGWDVIGGGEPAIPGVAIGHNQVAAWGLTIFAIDAEDLYVYELDATNRAYKYRGGFRPFRTEVDSVGVKGAAAVPVTLSYTHHGPVLYVDSAAHRAVALRAAWLEPGGAPYLASLRLDQARTWTEARAALAFARMPALNWVWADTSGTIGWQTAGIAPIRRSYDGLLPVPGDGRFEWAGFLPIAELPHEVNPKRGFVGTANAFNVPPTYLHFNAIGKGSWADPFRVQRLTEVLDTTRRATLPRMAALQHDETPIAARSLVPLLKGIELTSALAKTARDTLLAWNGVLDIASRGGAIYAAWERRLLTHTADMVLPL